jgi:hypothetical protein
VTTLTIWMQTVDAGLFAWEVAALGFLFTRWLLAHFVEFPLAGQSENPGAQAGTELSWMQRP